MSSMEVGIAAAIMSDMWAVVGASSDRIKYRKINERDLREAGFNVYSVNPSLDEVERCVR